MARGISLHVGLNSVDPAHYDGWNGQLAACEADANAMHAIADSRGFASEILLTQAATSTAVTERIAKAASELASGDFFFLTYAGHGGQVPDRNGDEVDRTDETWVLFDRQLVDDELYALWATFAPGVRIFLVSDSCHSGSVARGIDQRVPDPVTTAERAAAQSPRFRALPRDTMIATYRANAQLYDQIQDDIPSSKATEAGVGASVLLISGCQDDELSRDGFANGRFTEEFLKVWDAGAWKGPYPDLHAKIGAGMPDDQHPNYFPVGAASADFESQEPLTIG
jgi:metacaspase-1